MSTGAKAKAWRGVYCLRHGEWAVRKDDGFLPNCTVIPDGAPVPLPADVRRVLKAALQLEVQHTGWDYVITGGDPKMFMRAVASYRAAHERAEKRRKAGGR